MKTAIEINGRNINVGFRLYAFTIFNNDNELTQLLKTNSKAVTDAFVLKIKEEYFKLYNKVFTVSNKSMAVEIWAHVYVEKFAKALKSVLPFKLFNKLNNKIIFHCKEIDIGEKGHDNNRFVWDLLAPLKSIIGGILFFRQAGKKNKTVI